MRMDHVSLDGVTLQRVGPGYLVSRDGVHIGSVERSQHTYQQDRHRSGRHLTHHDCWYPSTDDINLPVYGHYYRRRDAVAAIIQTRLTGPRE